ncbi:MAG: proteasome accessory factor PafA2 family protein [Fimbriimonadaceae bacterium]|nr:proteasome accessory factor PafA2 family protein [Fimbriimonadaceae bacterium]
MNQPSILAGIDTEFGFTVEDRTVSDQADDSIALVRAYPGEGFLGWDYRSEFPRRDMRGFQVDRLAFDPEDAKFDEGRARPPAAEERSDRILPNGARFYNDHGHPEYATPECWTLNDLVAHDQLGEQVVANAAEALSKQISRKVKVYKNNTDFHGASYGTHENYLVPRSIEFNELALGLMPMLVARQVLVGAGKVGSESKGPVRYQISQRADFFVEPMNVETLYRRPVFNTRDEPHAAMDEWRRLHVICGDSNMHPGCTRRKAGLIKLAVTLIEQDKAPLWRIDDPVRSFQLVSRDVTGEGRVELEGANWTTPRNILESYLDAADRAELNDPEIIKVILECRALLANRAGNWDEFWPYVDWAAKLWLLEQFAEAEGGWEESTMQSLDLNYHLLDAEEGLYAGLASSGYLRLPDIPVTSINEAPTGSRAVARSVAVRKFSKSIKTASWEKITFDSPSVSLDLLPNLWYEKSDFDVESIEALISRVNELQ